jgi:hypothetical protein
MRLPIALKICRLRSAWDQLSDQGAGPRLLDPTAVPRGLTDPSARTPRRGVRPTVHVASQPYRCRPRRDARPWWMPVYPSHCLIVAKSAPGLSSAIAVRCRPYRWAYSRCHYVPGSTTVQQRVEPRGVLTRLRCLRNRRYEAPNGGRRLIWGSRTTQQRGPSASCYIDYSAVVP